MVFSNGDVSCCISMIGSEILARFATGIVGSLTDSSFDPEETRTVERFAPFPATLETVGVVVTIRRLEASPTEESSNFGFVVCGDVCSFPGVVVVADLGDSFTASTQLIINIP